MPEQSVFISYSRRHESLVTPLVTLLRIGDRRVFQDVTSIELGSKWEQSIIDSLREANVVVIIWCSHAALSEWVKKELREAVASEKTVIPVRIDQTPLPDELGKYQGLDLSEQINHGFQLDSWPWTIIICLIIALASGKCGGATAGPPIHLPIAIVALVFVSAAMVLSCILAVVVAKRRRLAHEQAEEFAKIVMNEVAKSS